MLGYIYFFTLICFFSHSATLANNKKFSLDFCNTSYWLNKEFPKPGQTIGGYKVKKNDNPYSMKRNLKNPNYSLLDPSNIQDQWAKDSLEGALEDLMEFPEKKEKYTAMKNGLIPKVDFEQLEEEVNELALAHQYLGKALSTSEAKILKNPKNSSLTQEERTEAIIADVLKSNNSEIIALTKKWMNDKHNRAFRVFKLGKVLYGGAPVGRSTPGRLEQFVDHFISKKKLNSASTKPSLLKPKNAIIYLNLFEDGDQKDLSGNKSFHSIYAARRFNQSYLPSPRDLKKPVSQKDALKGKDLDDVVKTQADGILDKIESEAQNDVTEPKTRDYRILPTINEELRNALSAVKDLPELLPYKNLLTNVIGHDKVDGRTHAVRGENEEETPIHELKDFPRAQANLVTWYLNAQAPLLGVPTLDKEITASIESAAILGVSLRGCDGQHHRGVQEFINELAFAGCNPSTATSIGEKIFGMNGVKTRDRESIASAFKALGHAYPKRRKQYALLFSGKLKPKQELDFDLISSLKQNHPIKQDPKFNSINVINDGVENTTRAE